MLRDMRSPSGGPSGPLRLLALVVVVGLLVATAPLIILPVLRGLSGMLF